MLHVLYSIGGLSSPTYFTFTSLSFDTEIHRLFCVIGVFCSPHQNILKTKETTNSTFLRPLSHITSWVSGGSVASAVDAGFWSRSAARRSFREYSQANAQYEGLEDFMIPFQRWDFQVPCLQGSIQYFIYVGIRFLENLSSSTSQMNHNLNHPFTQFWAHNITATWGFCMK